MAKDTKKRIIDAALILFANNGYEATSMVEIADAVGIKAPSLYAHYKNKQALFDAMVETMRAYFWQTYPALHTAASSQTEEAKMIGGDTELIKKLSVSAFCFYFCDKYAGTFRRLLSVERYRNPQMNFVFKELYLDAPIVNQTELFSELIRQGYVSASIDPRQAALQFFSPFLFLMNKYDGMPEHESEAIQELEAHIEQFVKRFFYDKGYPVI